jgi:Flp pilus assembly protein TadD
MTTVSVRPKIVFFMATLFSLSSCSRFLWAEARVELKHGKELHEAGQVKKAISRYEMAIADDPTLSEAEFFLGLAWADLEDWDQAVTHSERCLSLDPKNAKCEANLAGILVLKGSRHEARQRYEHCLSLDPNLEIAHKELADILSGEGEYDKAIDHYEKAILIRPDFKEAKENLAFARTLIGR